MIIRNILLEAHVILVVAEKIKDQEHLDQLARKILNTPNYINENNKNYFTTAFQDKILSCAIKIPSPDKITITHDLTLAILQGKITGLSKAYFSKEVLQEVKNQAELYRWDQILEELILPVAVEVAHTNAPILVTAVPITDPLGSQVCVIS